jgi:methyl-accepting chemotaxis protein
MSAELSRIVRINEEIKKVVRVAFQVNLMAINAILTARRAGQAARGFSVISAELRHFSTGLETGMQEIRRQTCRTVAVLGQQLKSGMFSTVLMRARALRPSPILEEVLERREREDAAVRTEMVGVQGALVKELHQAIQLGERGQVLARSAKIEASCVGEHSNALAHVAIQFEQTVEQILASLLRLNQHNKTE